MGEQASFGSDCGQHCLPGAICIPNETIGSEKVPELADKDQLIMVYCRSGNRSKQAAESVKWKRNRNGE